MTKISSISLAVSLAFLAPLGSASEQGLALEEVTIVALKRPQSLQRAPASVTVLSEAKIDQRDITNIASMATSVPAMHFTGYGSLARVTIRGVGVELFEASSDPGVALYMDGVYQAQATVHRETLFDLARVEVLRGPQGTLYGRNALGGSINLISNAPTEELGGEIEVLAGDYDRERLRGVVNVPLIEDRLLLRVSGQYESRDGFYENQTPGGDDLEDIDTHNLRGQLLYRRGDNFSALLNVNYSTMEGAGWGAAALGDYPLTGDLMAPFYAQATPNPAGPWKIRTNEGIQDRDNERKGAALTLNWELDSIAFKSITAWQDHTVDIVGFEWDWSDADILNEAFYRDSTQYSQEFQIRSTSDGNLGWLAGAYWFSDETDSDVGLYDQGAGLSTYPFFPVLDVGLEYPVMYGISGTYETDVLALFGTVSYQLTPSVSISAGLRYNDEERSLKQSVKDFVDSTLHDYKRQDDDWSNTTWKLGADWTISDASFLYASVSTGYRSGGFTPVPEAPTLDEEDLLAWEVGAKNRFFDNRLQANFSAYYYDHSDMQLNTIKDGIKVVDNAGDATIKGAEIELLGRPMPAFEVSAALAYTDAEFDDYIDSDPLDQTNTPQNLSGNRLPRTPEYTLNLAAQYSWVLAGGSLTASVNYYWSDEVYFSAYNRDDLDYQDSYHATDALLRFSSAGNRWSVAAGVKNIEDDEVANHIQAPLAPALGGVDFAFWREPRTYYMEVGYSF